MKRLDEMIRAAHRICRRRQREQSPDARIRRVDQMLLGRVSGGVAEGASYLIASPTGESLCKQGQSNCQERQTDQQSFSFWSPTEFVYRTVAHTAAHTFRPSQHPRRRYRCIAADVALDLEWVTPGFIPPDERQTDAADGHTSSVRVKKPFLTECRDFPRGKAPSAPVKCGPRTCKEAATAELPPMRGFAPYRHHKYFVSAFEKGRRFGEKQTRCSLETDIVQMQTLRSQDSRR